MGHFTEAQGPFSKCHSISCGRGHSRLEAADNCVACALHKTSYHFVLRNMLWNWELLSISRFVDKAVIIYIILRVPAKHFLFSLGQFVISIEAKLVLRRCGDQGGCSCAIAFSAHMGIARHSQPPTWGSVPLRMIMFLVPYFSIHTHVSWPTWYFSFHWPCHQLIYMGAARTTSRTACKQVQQEMQWEIHVNNLPIFHGK